MLAFNPPRQMVTSLPMRIEAQSHYEAANIAMGYQPTYEELKP